MNPEHRRLDPIESPPPSPHGVALLVLQAETLRRLALTPAPDLPSLSAKIALAVDNQAWDLTGAEPCFAALKADARRLIRIAPALPLPA